jgi:tetratricopeptide (TPR) repeat protein
MYVEETNRIDSLLAANNYAEATKLIKRYADIYLNTGQYATMARWLTKIPSADTEISLKFILAQSLIHTGEPHAAGAILTTIITTHSLDDQNVQNVVKALIWRSAAHRLSGNLKNAVIDGEASLSLLKNAPYIDLLAAAEFRLANALLDLGNLDGAMEHLTLALDSSANGFDLDLIARIQNSFGALYLRLGDMANAAVHLEYAREAWSK